MVEMGDSLMQKRFSGIKFEVGVMKESCWVGTLKSSYASAQCYMDTSELEVSILLPKQLIGSGY